MEVLRAEAAGMCFGVRDALVVAAGIQNAAEVTIHGELVHNEVVLHQLDARGFRRTPEANRATLPDTQDVLITAHGMSQAERARLEAAGKRLIDTTCPLVRRVHDAAQQLAAAGFHVIVIGRPGHVEVQGIIEDLAHYNIVSSVADVTRWPHTRLGIVCQTTTPPQLALDIHRDIERQNLQAEVCFRNTVCQPTRDRQLAVKRLCGQVQAVVVVGGKNSNNTRQLVALCRQEETPAHHVQSADDLQAEWFSDCDVVGLTAGTSTLDETIDAVHQRLLAMPACV